LFCEEAELLVLLVLVLLVLVLVRKQNPKSMAGSGLLLVARKQRKP
jgi:hypothetical protein